MTDAPPKNMNWMVGVDARGLSHGAIAFARWLASAPLNSVLGVHIVEWSEHDTRHPHDTDEAQLLASADHLLGPLREDVTFDELGVVPATHPEAGLTEAVLTKRADALVVGRRAPRTGSPLVRLGRTARRLLRQLPAPVVVVPPDLDNDEIGRGPVLLAVDFTLSCERATVFATRLAASMARPLVLVHAVHPPDRGPYVPADLWGHTVTELHRRGTDDLQTWAEQHDLDAAEQVLERGPAVEVLDRLARQRDAAIIVVGSRRLGGMERLFMTSLGTALAASSATPVAVVPPA